MTGKLEKRLELRVGSDDLTRWQRSATESGHRSVSEWIRRTLNDKADLSRLNWDVRQRVNRGLQEAAQTAIRPEFSKSTLENGVRVITESIPHSQSVSIGVLVCCSPRDEAAGEAGLSQLSERLIFQGTSNRNALQIHQLVDSVGGRISGFTGRDYTCYSASVLNDYSFHALDLMGDILLNSTFPQGSLEREREAIISEIECAQDMPEARAQSLLKQIAWPEHSLGRPIAGSRETVRGFSREDVIRFVTRHYTPDRIIVSAAGHVEHDDFVAQSRDVFWRLLGEGQMAPVSPPRSVPGFAVEESSCEQSYFCIGIPVYSYSHPNRFALHVLNKVIGGGVSSRLFFRLREELGLVYSIRSEYQAYAEAGMLVIEGSTSRGQERQVLEAVLSTLSELAAWSKPVTDEEISTAKMQILGEYSLSGEHVHTRMSRAAVQEFYFGRTIQETQVTAEVDDVSIDRLQRLAETELMRQLSGLSVAWVAPKSEAAQVETLSDVVEEYRKNFVGLSAQAGKRRESEVQDRAAKVQRRSLVIR